MELTRLQKILFVNLLRRSTDYPFTLSQIGMATPTKGGYKIEILLPDKPYDFVNKSFTNLI